MKRIFLIALIFCGLTGRTQNFVSGKYIIIDSVFADVMTNTVNADVNHRYNFGVPVKTVGGRWTTPAVNYIYFPFPDVVTVEKLPIDSFPSPVIVNTTTPTK
jgi:hypothetical protein